ERGPQRDEVGDQPGDTDRAVIPPQPVLELLEPRDLLRTGPGPERDARLVEHAGRVLSSAAGGLRVAHLVPYVADDVVPDDRPEAVADDDHPVELARAVELAQQRDAVVADGVARLDVRRAGREVPRGVGQRRPDEAPEQEVDDDEPDGGVRLPAGPQRTQLA